MLILETFHGTTADMIILIPSHCIPNHSNTLNKHAPSQLVLLERQYLPSQNHLRYLFTRNNGVEQE